MTYAGEIQAYYDRGEERDRLAEGKGALEFERTQEILRRALPATPALIADIGGGPGRYATWLADLGYTVQHRDLVRCTSGSWPRWHATGISPIGPCCSTQPALWSACPEVMGLSPHLIVTARVTG